MPEKSEPRLHSFKVEDDLWMDAQAAARANDETLSQVLRDALRKYVAKHERSKR